MGWGRYFLLGDLGQQLDLSDQKRELEDLKYELLRNRSSPASADVAGAAAILRLQEENDELRLYLAAVVRILVSKGVVSKEQLKQFVDVIDGEDGVKDGRFDGNLG